MNAKEYLQQAQKIDRIVKSKLAQIERLESLATSATQVLDPTGSHASADPTKGSKLENMVISIVDLKEQAQKQAAKLMEIRKEIMETLNKVSNLSVQFILEERYLLYRSWDSIAEETGFSKSYLFHMHSTGLQLVESIINR
jgi:predicted DNA-binding protein (UPF0251 family)